MGEARRARRNHSGEVVWPSPKEWPGGDKLRLRAVRIISNGEITGDVDITNDIIVEIDYWNLRPGANVSVSFHLFDKSGIWVLCAGNSSVVSSSGLFRARCILPGNFLNKNELLQHQGVLILMRPISKPKWIR